MVLSETIKEIPTIELDTVKLRKIRTTDASDLFEYYNNKNVYQYLDWNGPDSINHAEEIINIWNNGFDENWIMRFAIADKSTDKIIGTIFLNSFDGKRAEIGYELSEEFWRCGVMSQAIKAVLILGFEKLQLERIQGFVSSENVASKQILMKFGFEEEGYLRKYETNSVTGLCKDMYIYGLIKEEFKF